MIPETELIETYNQILQLGGLGVGVLAVTVVLLMVGLGYLFVRMFTRTQTADSETTQQIVTLFGSSIGKLNDTMEALRTDVAARNETQREQLRLLTEQAKTQTEQLQQFRTYGKDQNEWHGLIEGTMSSVNSTLVDFSNKINRLENNIMALTDLLSNNPEDHERIEKSLTLIAKSLDNLHSKFDTMQQPRNVEANVTIRTEDDSAHDEAA